MAEKQILGFATGAAPRNRVTKDSERFALLAVNATFDGTGASGDFLPTVEILSDSGDVVGRFPTQETVAAGDSAEVTFAPFLRGAAAAAPPVTSSWQFAANQSGGDTIPSQAPGFVTKLNLDPAALYTTNPAMYSIEPATVGGKFGLAIHETGCYLLAYSVQFFSNGAYDPLLLDLTVSAGEGGSLTYLVPTVLGSFKARGLQDGTQNAWTVTWEDVIVMTAADVAASTGNPIVTSAQQQSGNTADVYQDVFAVQVSTDTFGL